MNPVYTTFARNLSAGKKLYQFLSFALLLMWSYAAISKFSELDSNRRNLELLFGHRSGVLLSVGTPLAETAAVLLLLFARTRKWGLRASFLLMIAFTVYVGMVTSGLFGHVPCTCGGLFAQLSWRQHLVFNAAVALLHLPLMLTIDKTALSAIVQSQRKEVPCN